MIEETRDMEDNEEELKRYVSDRGSFEIFENPPIGRTWTPESINVETEADKFEYSKLAEECGEAETRQKIGEMVVSMGHGVASTRLFAQDSPNGMSLVHVWFGPNFPLFRHSHPAHGDCLYYVVAGEVLLGKRRLGPGSGFFVPNGMPYKYTAGPAGLEVLEFRAGGGEEGAPGMKLDEHSLGAIERLIDRADEHRSSWQVPEKIGDTALKQAELDRES
jgi:hypothetical protein